MKENKQFYSYDPVRLTVAGQAVPYTDQVQGTIKSSAFSTTFPLGFDTEALKTPAAEEVVQLKAKRLDPSVKFPTYATDGSGARDFYSSNSGVVKHGEATVFGTGLALEIPKNYVLLLFSRSGHGFNQSLRLSNCVGVIDSDFRGEVKLSMTCDATEVERNIQSGDRIAQGIVVYAPRFEFIEVESLSDTSRGSGGLGSTGS